MDKIIYNKIRNEYEKKRDTKIRIARLKEEEILKNNSKLKSIKDEINETAILSTRLLLGENSIKRDIEKENLSIKLKKLDEKYQKELERINVDISEITPKFDCKLCLDTGLIKNSDGSKSMCKCFEQRLINETYNEANMLRLNEENFNTFDTGYYSKNIDKEKYGIDKSPLDNIMNILEESKKFCNNIMNRNQKNLLFTGNTGLGKTFIANGIADNVIRQGMSVIYQTAPILI